jgi:PAS domain S-box-containing protein
MIKILIVDDNAEERHLNKIRLSSYFDEIDVREAESPIQALEFLKHDKVDCIISDFQMPPFNGLEFLKRLRDGGDETPFIFLTGQGSEQVAAEALRCGADDYFTKDESFAHYQRLHNSILHVVAAYRTKRERDETIRALEESERKYRSLIEAAPNPLAIIQDGKIKYANTHLLGITGYAFEEVFGRPFTAFVPNEEVPKVFGNYGSRMAGEESRFSYETVLLAKDGSRIDVNVSASEVVIEDQRAVLAHFHDIRGQKRIEKASRLNELAVNSSPDLILWIDPHGKLLSANDSAYRALRYSSEDLLSKSIHDVLQDYSRGKWSRLWTEIKRVKSTVVESRITDRDGHTRPVEVLLNYLEYEGSDCCYAIMRNITAPLRSAVEFNDKGPLLASIISSSKDAIIAADKDGTVLVFNPAAEKMFGVPREEALGKSLDRIIPEGYRESHKQYIKDFFTTGYPNGAIGQTIELPACRSDGSSFPIELTLSVGKRDEEPFVLAVIRDISKRKRTELEWRQSERIYRALFEQANDAVFRLSLDGIYLDANQKAADMLGYSREDLVGMLFREVVAPGQVEDAEAQLTYLLEGGRPQAYERAFITKTGEEVISESNVALIRDVEGRPKFFQSIVRDITERKRAEAALRASEEKYRKLIENSPDTIMEIDRDGTIIFANHFGEHINVNDMIGKNVRMLPSPGDHDDFVKDIEKVFSGVSRTESNVFNLLGKLLLGRVFPVLDDEGKVAKVITVATDITALEEAKRARLESEEKFKNILEHAHDAVLIFDLEANIVFANLQAMKLMSPSNGHELIGAKVFNYVLADAKEQAVSALETVIREGVVKNVEVPFTRSDGKNVRVEINASLIRDAEGKPVSILAMCRDISVRKRYEENLMRSRDQLAATNKELEAFSYSVSHDLKAPLRHIKGFSDILNQNYSEKLDDAGRKAMESIGNAVTRMQQIIEGLLRLSSSTNTDLKRSLVDLSSMAEELFELHRSSEPDRAVQVDIEKELNANCDRMMVKTVLDNIICNAWKFTGKKERALIKFGVENCNGERVFFIRDNGAGFDPTKTEKMFIPFQRLSSSKGFEGTGIGLSIVQRIIHKHGGRIWAEGELDRGATFYFTLGE